MPDEPERTDSDRQTDRQPGRQTERQIASAEINLHKLHGGARSARRVRVCVCVCEFTCVLTRMRNVSVANLRRTSMCSIGLGAIVDCIGSVGLFGSLPRRADMPIVVVE